MKQHEFEEQINRLKNAYGDRNYPDERTVIFWDEFKFSSVAWFQRTVSELIATHRQPPLLNEFRDHMAKEREKNFSKNKIEANDRELSEKISCARCKDTGIILCTKENPMFPGPGPLWAFRCDCSKGMSDPRTGIPYFNQHYRQIGFTWHDLPAIIHIDSLEKTQKQSSEDGK